MDRSAHQLSSGMSEFRGTLPTSRVPGVRVDSFAPEQVFLFAALVPASGLVLSVPGLDQVDRFIPVSQSPFPPDVGGLSSLGGLCRPPL